MTIRRLGALLCVAGFACRGGDARRSTAPAPDPWQRVELPHSAVTLYAYPDPIVRYAPDDRGGYVVHLAGEAGARRALAIELRAGDDVVGDDGYVLRLTEAEATALAARAGVTAVTPLAASARLGAMIDRSSELPEVRIELFADARADEVEAMAAWVAWRGGTVSWTGRTALRARLPLEVRADAARLSVVRWIE